MDVDVELERLVLTGERIMPPAATLLVGSAPTHAGQARVMHGIRKSKPDPEPPSPHDRSSTVLRI